MSISLVEVMALLLAIGQVQEGQSYRTYRADAPMEMAVDMGVGCRALFQNSEFLTVDQISQMVTKIQEQLAAEKEGPSEDEPERRRPNRRKRSFQPEGAGESLLEALKAIEVFKGFDFSQAIDLWSGVCSGPPDLEKVAFIDWPEVADYYNKVTADLPSVEKLRHLPMSQTSKMLSSTGDSIGEYFQEEARRQWVRLDEIPRTVQRAFIAVEDGDFLNHKGIDENGVVRGFMKYLRDKSEEKRIQGGSTITQQVVKNTLVGNKFSLDRKIREILLAREVEKTFSKEHILEIYLNIVYLGRSSWGVGLAAESYFGKPVKKLSLKESAFLAGVTHLPLRYQTGNDEAIQSRLNTVFGQLALHEWATGEEISQARSEKLNFIEVPRLKAKSFFTKAVQNQLVVKLGEETYNRGGLRVETTLHPPLQKATELALQESLYSYEVRMGRLKFSQPVAKLADEDLAGDNWSRRLEEIAQKYEDIAWTPVVITKKSGNHMSAKDKDGNERALSLHGGSSKSAQRFRSSARRELNVGDVVFAVIHNNDYQLRVAPLVQGAAVVMESNSGRILAMSGGFSYTYPSATGKVEEHNRAQYCSCQPGSTVKPFVYLQALQLGFQPNTIIPNAPVYFPRVGDQCSSWNPGNYSYGGASQMTLRRGLESSNNRVTVRLFKEQDPDFMKTLEGYRRIVKEFGIYDEPRQCAAILLGAQETTPLKMAAAYAKIANGGLDVEPRFLERVTNDNGQDFPVPRAPLRPLTTVDPVSIYQVRSILEGVISNGTAAGSRSRHLVGYVGGKTGTSNSHRAAWFVGFTHDLTVAVWVGYDNNNIYSSLGGQGTGGRAAFPVFRHIIENSFETYAAKRPLAPAPAGIDKFLTDRMTGNIVAREGEGVLIENYRVGSYDTQYAILRSPVTTARYDRQGQAILSGHSTDMAGSFDRLTDGSDDLVTRESPRLGSVRPRERTGEDTMVYLDDDNDGTIVFSEPRSGRFRRLYDQEEEPHLDLPPIEMKSLPQPKMRTMEPVDRGNGPRASTKETNVIIDGDEIIPLPGSG